MAADPGLAARLSAAADGLFRLRRARPHRRHPRHVDQGEPDADARGARRHRRLAEPALDREDGVRRAGRLRPDLRLAAPVLHPDRRGVHRRRADHARRRGRRSGSRSLPADELYVLGAHADGDRDRDPGRGRRRHVDRGRLPRAMPPATRGRRTTCAPISAWCRCSAGLRSWPAFSRWPGCPDGSPACFARETVFLLGLVVPAISVIGVLLIRSDTAERRPIDWRILGGGIAFGAVGARARARRRAVRPGDHLRPVDGGHLRDAGLRDPRARPRRPGAPSCSPPSSSSRSARRRRSATAISGGRSTCSSSTRRSTASCARPARSSRSWPCGCSASRSPNIRSPRRCSGSRSPERSCRCRISACSTACTTGPSRHSGFGARTIAVIDTAAGSPFAQLSMIPLLTLIAYYAPAGHRATWFALMASLMNLALVAGQLQTKYLNQVFIVGRGDYWRARPAADHRHGARPGGPARRHRGVWAPRVIGISACASPVKWPILRCLARSAPCPRMSRSARRR